MKGVKWIIMQCGYSPMHATGYQLFLDEPILGNEITQLRYGVEVMALISVQ